jgi:hypothetical protein
MASKRNFGQACSFSRASARTRASQLTSLRTRQYRKPRAPEFFSFYTSLCWLTLQKKKFVKTAASPSAWCGLSDFVACGENSLSPARSVVRWRPHVASSKAYQFTTQTVSAGT